jgi:hypothetical protein
MERIGRAKSADQQHNGKTFIMESTAALPLGLDDSSTGFCD